MCTFECIFFMYKQAVFWPCTVLLRAQADDSVLYDNFIVAECGYAKGEGLYRRTTQRQ